MDRKALNYFVGFKPRDLIYGSKSSIKKISGARSGNSVSIIWSHFWNHNSNHMVKNQRNNLAIFGQFLDLQEFFKNRGLIFATSDSDFRDLLEELFHKVN